MADHELKDTEGPPAAAAPASLDARKATILRTVVQEHILTGQPVGSGHLSASTGLAISSATIRNEMSVLEREGYLTHPHTSAGRIPTDRGYRYFVDSIAEPARLSDTKTAQVRRFFDAARADIEQLMAETSRLLTGLTDYAAVVVAPHTESVTIRSIQVVDLGSVALVVAVLSNGVVEKASFEAPDISESVVNASSARLNQQFNGRTLADVSQSTLPASGDPRVDSVCESSVQALRSRSFQTDQDSREVFVGGASRMVGAFDTVSTIRSVLATLEEQYVVVNLVREALDRPAPNPVHVSIGGEHGTDSAYESLLSCSVVVAPYMVDGKMVGTVGVLGPTRMDYPEAMAAVTAVSEGLTERLSDN
jgi:heat-inducible transcriptional repressor